MLIVVDNVYKCNYSNMVKYLRILCVNYLYIYIMLLYFYEIRCGLQNGSKYGWILLVFI